MARPKEVSDQEILEIARKRFLSCGAAVPTTAIAEEIGISHATIFNRFGSKEELLIAALGPPKDLPWAVMLAEGPDDRPLREQLEEIAGTLSRSFTHIAEGITLLKAAGVPSERIFKGCTDPPPIQAFNALRGWLLRARERGDIGECDIPALTVTILGALRNWSLMAGSTDTCASARAVDSYITKLVDLLWEGIAP